MPIEPKLLIVIYGADGNCVQMSRSECEEYDFLLASQSSDSRSIQLKVKICIVEKGFFAPVAKICATPLRNLIQESLKNDRQRHLLDKE